MPLRKRPRHLAQKDGDVVGGALVDGFTHVGPYKEAVRVKIVGVLRSGMGRRPLGMQMHHFDVAQFGCPRRHGHDQLNRGRRRSMHKDPVAGFDNFDCFFQRS